MVKIIEPKELKQMLDSGKELQLVDVREPFEREIAEIGGELVPLKEIGQSADKIRRDVPVIVYCRSGGRSERAVRELEAKGGFDNLYNLRGGILAWIDEVDPSLSKY